MSESKEVKKVTALESKPEKIFKVYLLKRIYSPDYDEYDGKVIVASSAKSARMIANQKVGDEGKIWHDSSQVICKEIPIIQPLIVLESFYAG